MIAKFLNDENEGIVFGRSMTGVKTIGNGKIILFHSSNTIVGNEENPINVSYEGASPEVDFGKGFYLTSNYGQAVDWAKAIVTRKRTGKECVNEFIFDMKKAQSSFHCLIENEYNASWLELVLRCRRHEDIKGFDIIAGRLADGFRLNKILAEYEHEKQNYKNDPEGLDELVARTAEALKFEQSNWYQICIKSQAAADKLLKFNGEAKQKADSERKEKEAKKRQKRAAQSLADKLKKQRK